MNGSVFLAIHVFEPRDREEHAHERDRGECKEGYERAVIVHGFGKPFRPAVYAAYVTEHGDAPGGGRDEFKHFRAASEFDEAVAEHDLHDNDVA